MKLHVLALTLAACGRPAVMATPVTPSPAPRSAPTAAATPEGTTVESLCGWLGDAEQQFEERTRAFEAEDHSQGFGTPPGSPQCEITPIDKFVAKDPWRRVGVFASSADIHQDHWWQIAIETNGWWGGPPAARDTEIVATVRDVIPGGGDELVVEDTAAGRSGITVCARDHRCTARFVTADDGWEVAVTFEDGRLVSRRVSGSPPADAIGAHPLVFQAFALAAPP
jgi:hypothetical protein